MPTNKKQTAIFDFGAALEDETYSPAQKTLRTGERSLLEKQSIVSSAESGFRQPLKGIDRRHLRQTNRTKLISMKVEPSVPEKIDSILSSLSASSRGHAVEILVNMWIENLHSSNNNAQ